MKRVKTWAVRCVVVACMAALAVCMVACSQETYSPEEGTPTISSPTIGEDGVLRVGVDSSSTPLAGQSTTSDNIVGIDVDIAAALADELGLKLEIVDVGDDPATALSEGTVDIVLGVSASNTSETYWLSDIYVSTAVALFTLEGSSTDIPANDSSVSIAAQVSSKSAWAVANQYDQSVISTTSNLEDAFTALADGEVSYVASDAIIGTFAAYNTDLDVQIVALMEEASGYCVAVLNTNTDLQSAISEALATISDNGTISIIEKKWLGTELDLSALAVTDTSSTTESESTTETAETTETTAA